jgi:hypothetical protein
VCDILLLLLLLLLLLWLLVVHGTHSLTTVRCSNTLLYCYYVILLQQQYLLLLPHCRRCPGLCEAALDAGGAAEELRAARADLDRASRGCKRYAMIVLLLLVCS